MEQLVGEHYEASKERVLGIVAARLNSHGAWKVDRLDLEAAYTGAWHNLWRHKAKDGPITDLDGLLITATYRLACNTHRDSKDSRRVALEIEKLPNRAIDLADATGDRLLLQELITRLARRLNAKELHGVVLCLLYGYSRAEAARALGLREPAFQKVMDRANLKMKSVIAGLRPRGCDEAEWAEAVRSYALGSLGEESRDYQRVREHLDLCADCRRYATGLEGLALLPPLGAPLLRFTHPAGGITGRVTRLLSRRHIAVGRVGSQGAAASRSSAGGIASILGGGGAKTAAIIAAAAGVAAATVPALSSHTSSRHHDLPARIVAVPQPLATQPAPAEVLPASQQKTVKAASRRHSKKPRHARTPASRRATQSAAGESAQSEFGFERPASPTASQPASSSAPAQRESQGNAAEAEFGFEGK